MIPEIVLVYAVKISENVLPADCILKNINF